MNKKSPFDPAQGRQSGQASRTIIILAIVILVVAAIVYGVTRLAVSRRVAAPAETTPPPPVYDVSIGDIRFLLESSVDVGRVLYGASSRNPKSQDDLITTERFIKVIVRAQNKGKTDTARYDWDLGSIVDSAGRVFIPISSKAYAWLPKPDLCGSILKPEFEPTPCVRYYEVSRASDGLKVEVLAEKPKSSKMLKDFIDLKISR